jgi:hypothetical protein
MRGIILAVVMLLAFPRCEALAQQMAPNGTWVGGTPQMAPDGSYVGGTPQMAPNGTWVGGTPQMAPDGSYVGVGGR